MGIDELLAAVATRGVELARYCHSLTRGSARARQLIADRFAVPGATAGRWLNLARELFGPLAPAGEKLLRDATVAHAETSELSIDVLLVINSALRHRLPGAPLSREQLRAELVAKAGGMGVDAVKTMANARIREINQGVDAAPAPTRRYFRASGSTDARGMRYATVCLPEADMSTLVRSLHTRAQQLRTSNRELSHQQAMADALMTRAGGADPGSHWLQPAVLMTMDDLNGRGDGTFATTNGTLITAAEYAAQKLAPYGLCLVYDKEAQPVDLFRIRRIASDKQRALISLDQLLCTDPDCTHTAATCQIHHIQSWARGGQTNLSNLVAACATHNARNDDDPTRPRNGRLVRCPDTGRAGWEPPDGGPIRFNPHPITARSGRSWALSRTASSRSP
ncbi:HNH endonuclease signature motif containing protein [Corynebacterium sp. A21]|uniref:HNH endonuclease signature motif containing protein n=1 Tax=Corynebacterium sp. A21 TaxID=3457318 RepID=UPI003FD469AA